MFNYRNSDPSPANIKHVQMYSYTTTCTRSFIPISSSLSPPSLGKVDESDVFVSKCCYSEIAIYGDILKHVLFFNRDIL
jgi:hypothetical protein